MSNECMSMPPLKPCPFCGGKGKVSFKDNAYGGHNGLGDKRIEYRIQVICNRCRSRGKPIKTGWIINPHPYISEWGNVFNPESEVCQRQTDLFRPHVEKAIEEWNRRAGESNE